MGLIGEADLEGGRRDVGTSGQQGPCPVDAALRQERVRGIPTWRR
jgi:hypothetical protein